MDSVLEVISSINGEIERIDKTVEEVREIERDLNIETNFIDGLLVMRNEYESRRKIIASNIGWLSLSYVIGTMHG
jgi:hypothetical protein